MKQRRQQNPVGQSAIMEREKHDVVGVGITLVREVEGVNWQIGKGNSAACQCLSDTSVAVTAPLHCYTAA